MSCGARFAAPDCDFPRATWSRSRRPQGVNALLILLCKRTSCNRERLPQRTKCGLTRCLGHSIGGACGGHPHVCINPSDRGDHACGRNRRGDRRERPTAQRRRSRRTRSASPAGCSARHPLRASDPLGAHGPRASRSICACHTARGAAQFLARSCPGRTPAQRKPRPRHRQAWRRWAAGETGRHRSSQSQHRARSAQSELCGAQAG